MAKRPTNSAKLTATSTAARSTTLQSTIPPAGGNSTVPATPSTEFPLLVPTAAPSSPTRVLPSSTWTPVRSTFPSSYSKFSTTDDNSVPEIVAAYYESIRSAQNSRYGYAFLCEEKLPSLSIAIGDAYVATINGSDMTYASLDDGSGYCLGGLQPGPGRFQILGGVFLKQFFAVFDGGEELRFGVALKN